MKTEIISIGNELLSGRTLNTNAHYLTSQLSAIGFIVVQHTTVSDEETAIAKVIHEAQNRADLIITTGGLGPTDDDKTIVAISRALNQKQVLHQKSLQHIQSLYRKWNRSFPRKAIRQAMLPEQAIALPNALGTAPGVWIKSDSAIIATLPGVPPEMKHMFEEVLTRLGITKNANTNKVIIRTIGIPELSIEKKMKALKVPKSIEVGFYPKLGLVDIALKPLQSKAPIQKTAKSITHLLGKHVYSLQNESLVEVVAALLQKNNKTIAIAESCTGGLLSNTLTNVPGSSSYVNGSVIAYQNEIKVQELGVPKHLLKRYGAVSAGVAKSMAEGIRKKFNADIGISTTGIAGPGGGTDKKPVGLVHFALASKEETTHLKKQMHGSREMIKHHSTQTALNLIRLFFH